MVDFDYEAFADLFPGRGRRGSRPVGYRRFTTAAEAIRFVMEQMPGEFLSGTVLEVEEQRFGGPPIRELYESAAYPLARTKG
jgi:hypothetical protein